MQHRYSESWKHWIRYLAIGSAAVALLLGALAWMVQPPPQGSERADAPPLAPVPNAHDDDAGPDAATAPSVDTPYPPATPSQVRLTADQRRGLDALRRNCWDVARHLNHSGEYSGMQMQACGDYAKFASRLGVSVELPEYAATPAPAVLPSRSTVTYGAPRPLIGDHQGQCQLLQDEKHRINARMRSAGYGHAEGEWLRQRLRDIDAAMWDLQCARKR